MRKMFIYCSAIVLFIIYIPLSSFAQQDAQFSQYMFNTLFLNPAYAGVEGQTKFQLIHRSQWTTYQSSFNDGTAPITQNFSVNHAYEIEEWSREYILLNDRLGPFKKFRGTGSYAYHFPVKNGKLSLGYRGGIYSQGIDFEKVQTIDPDDPILVTGQEASIR
jgi:type IX secretion system PorP/SprF family membrane protein